MSKFLLVFYVIIIIGLLHEAYGKEPLGVMTWVNKTISFIFERFDLLDYCIPVHVNFLKIITSHDILAYMGSVGHRDLT